MEKILNTYNTSLIYSISVLVSIPVLALLTSILVNI